jgi:putative alpha-1,2-mannosidase
VASFHEGLEEAYKWKKSVVSLPHGMMKVAPITTPGVTDKFLADRIYGFPVGCGYIMPIGIAAPSDVFELSSLYDHDLEKSTPYYYQVLLEDEGIESQMTVTHRSAYYRFVYPDASDVGIIIGLPVDGKLTVLDENTIQFTASKAGVPYYTHVEFSSPVVKQEDWVS